MPWFNNRYLAVSREINVSGWLNQWLTLFLGKSSFFGPRLNCFCLFLFLFVSLVFMVVVWDKSSLCSPRWPSTHHIAQDGFELMTAFLPLFSKCKFHVSPFSKKSDSVLTELGSRSSRPSSSGSTGEEWCIFSGIWRMLSLWSTVPSVSLGV